jgi:hypothetical protein
METFMGPAIGRALFVFDEGTINGVPDRIMDGVAAEESRLRDAIGSVRAEVAALDTEF